VFRIEEPDRSAALAQHGDNNVAVEGYLHLQSLQFRNQLVERATSMGERVRTVPCTICCKPVRLEECKVNDLAQPVHETCLAEWMMGEVKKRTTVVPE